MIHAVVIDDSAFNRVTISRMLESTGEVKVVAIAADGQSGIREVLRHRPDVITVDLEMPGMDGFSFLRWLMANVPTPVIAVSSQSDDRSVFKALELGAAEFIAKPGGPISPRLEEIRDDLLAKVRGVQQILVDHLASRRHEEHPPAIERNARVVTAAATVDLVVIGASTGGPPALQSLFEQLPILNIPFVIAQHMPPTFTRLFAERVDRLSSYAVKEAEAGDPLVGRTVYVAPGGRQTEVVRSNGDLKLVVRQSVAGELYAPSVDRLFDSASRACGDRLLAIVLTGMGVDGAASIRGVRARGGKTIAEAESTAIIFGMPGEAIRTGAIERVLPLGEIPGAISDLCSG